MTALFWWLAALGVAVLVIWAARREHNERKAMRATVLGDDTLAMVADDRTAADMWDSFEEADVHGIEVDDTAAEADVVSMKGTFLTPDGQKVGAEIWAHGPGVIAQERAMVAALEAWLKRLDVEAWLGERGWL